MFGATRQPRVNLLLLNVITLDQADLENVTKRGLEITGFNVKCECDPLQEIAFQGKVYALALLDIMVENIDGFELHGRLPRIEVRMKGVLLSPCV